MRLSRKHCFFASTQFAAVLMGCCPNSPDTTRETFFSSILSFTVSIFHVHPTHTPLSGISFRTERLISQRYSAGTCFIFKGKSSGQICGRPSKCHFGRLNAHDAGMPCVDIFACCFAFVCVFYYLLGETDSLFSFAKRFHLALFLIFKKAWCVLFHHYLTQL